MRRTCRQSQRAPVWQVASGSQAELPRCASRPPRSVCQAMAAAATEVGTGAAGGRARPHAFVRRCRSAAGSLARRRSATPVLRLPRGMSATTGMSSLHAEIRMVSCRTAQRLQTDARKKKRPPENQTSIRSREWKVGERFCLHAASRRPVRQTFHRVATAVFASAEAPQQAVEMVHVAAQQQRYCQGRTHASPTRETAQRQLHVVACP